MTRRSRSLRTVLAVVLAGSMLGGLSAVGIAVGCACWSELGSQTLGVMRGEVQPWQYRRAEGLGVERFSIRRTSPMRLMMQPEPDRLPAWAALPSPEDGSIVQDAEFVAVGWPMRCLSARRIFDLAHPDPLAEPWEDAYVLDAGFAFEAFSTRLVPKRVIAGGMAVNVTLFAVVWIVGLSTLIGARRIGRAARGRCPRCGYDLRGSTGTRCPECGREKKARRHAGAQTRSERVGQASGHV